MAKPTRSWFVERAATGFGSIVFLLWPRGDPMRAGRVKLTAAWARGKRGAGWRWVNAARALERNSCNVPELQIRTLSRPFQTACSMSFALPYPLPRHLTGPIGRRGPGPGMAVGRRGGDQRSTCLERVSYRQAACHLPGVPRALHPARPESLPSPAAAPCGRIRCRLPSLSKPHAAPSPFPTTSRATQAAGTIEHRF